MGAVRSHIQPSREQIHAAKQHLALAKKWESCTRDTLMIAWKQVEQATQHLESAREQVNDAESNLKTTSSSNSRDGNSATYNATCVEGGGHPPSFLLASKSKKKNLKGRAFALAAKSFRKGSDGGSRGGNVGDAAKKKMQADYEHRQQQQEEEDESKEKYIIFPRQGH